MGTGGGMDEELEMVLRISLEEEQRRQAALRATDGNGDEEGQANILEEVPEEQ